MWPPWQLPPRLSGDDGEMSDDEQTSGETAEMRQVRRNRRRAALEAGLRGADAYLFVNSDLDVGVLRKLAKAKCPPELIARILF